MGTAVQSAAPETRDICRESTDNLSLETIKAEFRDAGEVRAEYDSIHNNLETKALSAKKLIEDEVFPLLVKMHSLLSQRGTEHLRLEAGLRTWTEYYEAFHHKFGLKSLRTFQRRLLALTGADETERKPALKKKRFPFFTGEGEGLVDSALYRMLLLDLMQQIEKMGDKVPTAIRETVAGYRRDLNGENAGVPPKIVPPAAPKPKKTTWLEKTEKSIAREKATTQKGIARDVQRAVQNHSGTLIKI
jgi:hypothetical protein